MYMSKKVGTLHCGYWNMLEMHTDPEGKHALTKFRQLCFFLPATFTRYIGILHKSL
jgi:hypothetical protein